MEVERFRRHRGVNVSLPLGSGFYGGEPSDIFLMERRIPSVLEGRELLWKPNESGASEVFSPLSGNEKPQRFEAVGVLRERIGARGGTRTPTEINPLDP